MTIARGGLSGLALAGALAACSKPSEVTEGPAAVEPAKPKSVADETAPAGGCPEGMVRIEGNEALAPFCMGETEVSVREFRRCVDAKACRDFDPTSDFHDETKATWLLADESMPINYVDEEQARQYCAFVGGRLPTEAEWIWAYGSTKGWAFPWGNEFSYDTASYCGRWQRPGWRRGERELCPAKHYPQDRTLQGVYDMTGSADEIVGPNEKGQYGIADGFGSHAVPTDIRPTGTVKVGGQLRAWYGGLLVIWNDSTSFRCVGERPQ